MEEHPLGLLSRHGAILSGHFLLSSGLHSDTYVQCARALQHPRVADELARRMAVMLAGERFDAIVSPAMGGLIIGQHLARELDIPHMFVERMPDRTFALRRFEIEPGALVLMVEDVITTGLSSREAIAAIERAGGCVRMGASIIDRSLGTADIGVRYRSLLQVEARTFSADDVPDHLRDVPAIKPGSRPA
jgi:orotate phosphoribosyltransferase